MTKTEYLLTIAQKAARRTEYLLTIAQKAARRDHEGVEYYAELHNNDFGQILPQDLVKIMDEVRRIEQYWESTGR